MDSRTIRAADPKANLSVPVAVATVREAARPSMPAYLVEVAAKVIVWTDADQEDLAANVYALVNEFIHDDDHIVDLEVDTFALPLEPGGGPSDRRDGADPEEGSEAPVP